MVSRGDAIRRICQDLLIFSEKYLITLGQLKTENKSNEITAISDLLNLLDVSEAIVTIDATGYQTTTDDKIPRKEADFLISLKGNQGNFNEDVPCAFKKKTKRINYQQYSEMDIRS